jgi:glutamyl-tRNA synthetase
MADPARERVRFAPSPTGYFHVGGARTVLYNWLYARQRGGELLLRIDDTDAERNREEWVTGIIDAITWLGIDWDLGPIRQSSRTARYLEVAETLLAQGRAYWCDCTREALEARKQPGAPPGYDGHCRERGLERGPHTALRFRVEPTEVVVADLVRGEVRFPPGSIEDFVIVKSSGQPLYVLANVVDDVDFAITTVMRAEEHLPTTPKAVLIHQALGAPVPRFAHLPVLVNEERRKLSKRRDRVAVEDYRRAGYLPEALVNYLALLGWSPGTDQEFFTKEELIESFDLAGVGHSPAFFDERKLTHFNKHYLAALPPERFAQLARPYVADLIEHHPRGEAIFAAMCPLVQPRIATLAEARPMMEFALLEGVDYRGALQDATDEDLARLRAAKETLAALDRFGEEEIEGSLRSLATELGTSLRKLQAPVRLAVTGAPVGPPLFGAMAILGREESLARLDAAVAGAGPEPLD